MTRHFAPTSWSSTVAPRGVHKLERHLQRPAVGRVARTRSGGVVWFVCVTDGSFAVISLVPRPGITAEEAQAQVEGAGRVGAARVGRVPSSAQEEADERPLVAVIAPNAGAC